jgi:hypothetical protein
MKDEYQWMQPGSVTVLAIVRLLPGLKSFRVYAEAYANLWQQSVNSARSPADGPILGSTKWEFSSLLALGPGRMVYWPTGSRATATELENNNDQLRFFPQALGYPRLQAMSCSIQISNCRAGVNYDTNLDLQSVAETCDLSNVQELRRRIHDFPVGLSRHRYGSGR